MKTRIFRWKAVLPLAVIGGFVALFWVFFADGVARRAAESLGTRAVGARVEIRDLQLGLGSVTLRGLRVASPHEPFKNLLEADELAGDLAVLPLLEKKVVIDQMAATGLRFGTPRETDGRVPRRAETGEQGGALELVRTWLDRLEIPVLQLATGAIDIDTLDPGQLSTVREARALGARADSSRQAWQGVLVSLRDTVTAAVSAADAMLGRLRGARPTDLALLNDARKTLEQVRGAQERVGRVERELEGGLASLNAGVAALDAARSRDYARARELVKLPSFDAATVGTALFGREAVGRFQRALYWAELGRKYMPPGLKPRPHPGPSRARRSGTTVHFPRAGGYPTFLLREAELSFVLDAADSQPAVYSGRLAGLTTEPGLYGRPTTLEAVAPAVRAGARLDHTGDEARDSAALRLERVALPALRLGALPIELDPGAGTMGFSLALAGDSIAARWQVRSPELRALRDTGAAGLPIADIAWRALSGISNLDVSAGLSGGLASPRFSVSSNLDRALADQLRAALGEEVAAAERQLRAEVDRLTEAEVAPAVSRVSSLGSEVGGGLAAARAELDRAERALAERLRQLTGIRLPGGA
jgi:uncharacterized protein (TIGR03545 family)